MWFFWICSYYCQTVVFLAPSPEQRSHKHRWCIWVFLYYTSAWEITPQNSRFRVHMWPNGVITCCIRVPYWFPPIGGHFSPMSGWPSGLRRQTQGSALSLDKGFQWRFLVLLWGRGFESHFWQQIFWTNNRKDLNFQKFNFDKLLYFFNFWVRSSWVEQSQDKTNKFARLMTSAMLWAQKIAMSLFARLACFSTRTTTGHWPAFSRLCWRNLLESLAIPPP